MVSSLYLFRHGDTEWSLSGRHTGRTDLPLTEKGREEARLLRPIFRSAGFAAVFCSPLARAVETAEIAGAGAERILRDELREWDYGDYEGRTTEEIRREVPDWTLWRDGCPHGETAAEVAARADAIIGGLAARHGDCALISHGHFLRVLAARWLGQPAEFGRFLLLETGTLSILGFEREQRVIRVWNSPRSP